MWNQPTHEELNELPRLYSTEDKSIKDKLIYIHFFIGGSDWYIAEYDPKDRIFFGYAILNNDLQNAEWGYMSLDELAGINVRGIEVDRDMHWKPTRFWDIEGVQKGYRYNWD